MGPPVASTTTKRNNNAMATVSGAGSTNPESSHHSGTSSSLVVDHDLAKKLRDAIHKEAAAYSDHGSPIAITQFLKDLLATYGEKPTKVSFGK